MKHILTILLAGTLLFSENRLAKPKIGKKFKLDYYELPKTHEAQLQGDIICEFTISKDGTVIDPKIVQTFAPEYNVIIINKLKATRYKPALQNGRPVAIRYLLPIKFE